MRTLLIQVQRDVEPHNGPPVHNAMLYLVEPEVETPRWLGALVLRVPELEFCKGLTVQLAGIARVAGFAFAWAGEPVEAAQFDGKTAAILGGLKRLIARMLPKAIT